MEENVNSKTVGQKYEELRATVSQYETRAEDISRLTKPMIFPKDSFTGSSDHEDSLSSSMGAIAVDSLTNKIVNALLPSASIPFKLEPDKAAMEMITQGDSAVRSEINTMLTGESIRINKEMEAQDMRTPLYDIIQYLMVVGSVVVEKIPKKGIKYHGLRTFAVELDDGGEAQTIILKEEVNPRNLPEGITLEEGVSSDEKIDLLTEYAYDNGTWYMRQELAGEPLGDSKSYSPEKLPVQYIGWSFNKGDTYHRSFCESRRGDLNSYDVLATVMNGGSVVSSKVLMMVNPLGSTRMRDIAESENGDVIQGRADDVTSLQTNKNFDFQIPYQMLGSLRESISESFLMNKNATRDAERVTAQEVAYMARELETVLSGMYSKFSTSITKRFITWIMEELSVKLDAIDVNIITGLNALGADVEAQKLDGFLARVAQHEATGLLDMREVVDRYANYLGINQVGIVKTEKQVSEEQAASQEAQQKQMMMEAGAQSLGQSAGQGIGQTATQPQEGQPQQ